MDQLKKAIQWLNKYHFWVLSIVAMLIGVAVWYTSAGALGKEYKQNEGKIKQEFSAAQTIASQPFHANPQINKKQQAEIRKRAKTVAAIWQELYERQRSQVLQWPEKVLGQDFCNFVENLKFGQDIPQDRRTHYQNYIQNYFPELPAMIKSPIVESNIRGGGGFVRPSGREEVADVGGTGLLSQDYFCVWHDQQHVRDELEFLEMPSPLLIWWTQENLWAYETLLTVIAATNAAVQTDRPDNAAVREIHALEVGQSAAKVVRGERIKLSAAVRATSAPASAIDPATGRAPEPEGRDDGTGTPSPEREQALLLSGRYVDSTGNPIPVSGGLVEFQTHFGTEYKQLPIRLVLTMDLRSLSFLIAQCANQPLQVEVKEVRINPADRGAGVTGGRVSFDLDAGRGLMSGGAETFRANPNIGLVVISGVIYIFNEPNPDILKAAQDDAEIVQN
jgi:hypothetical protein